MEDAGEQSAPLKSRLAFIEGPCDGLIATTTNIPSIRRLRVRVYDDTDREHPAKLGEFVVRNELL
jgi:hypothetical protein